MASDQDPPATNRSAANVKLWTRYRQPPVDRRWQLFTVDGSLFGMPYMLYASYAYLEIDIIKKSDSVNRCIFTRRTIVCQILSRFDLKRRSLRLFKERWPNKKMNNNNENNKFMIEQESSAKLTNQRVSYAFPSKARLISMPVIFCLPPSSSIVILVFYLFSTGIREQHVWDWELWVWIQSTGLTLPLRVTPMNNPIKLITSIVAGLHFCCADSYVRSAANFRIVFAESQNASPLDAEFGPHFNGKWPFKVIQGHQFWRQWRATKGLHSTI